MLYKFQCSRFSASNFTNNGWIHTPPPTTHTHSHTHTHTPSKPTHTHNAVPGAKTYGVPSTTKFKLSNFVVEHAIVIFECEIVIFEHEIVIFKHSIVQLKYEIRNGMLILLFNMKPLIGLFKANIHYATMAFLFESHSTIVMFNSELHPAITICNVSFGMRSDAFFYGRHSSKIIPLPWQCINIK